MKAASLRVSIIVFLTTAVSSAIFQATTFALPKVFDERLRGVASSFATWLEALGVPGNIDIATMIGAFAFGVFAVASIAQLVVGKFLDIVGPRPVFIVMAVMQLFFFFLMPGLKDGLAFAVALGFVLGVFGQIPINNYMVGRIASGEARARIYGARYVVSFTSLAAALPLIAFVHENWGFDVLFRILSAAAFIILISANFTRQKSKSSTDGIFGTHSSGDAAEDPYDCPMR